MKLIHGYLGLVVFTLLFMAATAILAACGGSKEAASPSAPMAIESYQELNDNVLSGFCLRCHTGGARDLSSYDAVMRYVTAGNAEGSKLCQVVKSGSMPPGNPLPQALQEALCGWIEKGASQ